MEMEWFFIHIYIYTRELIFSIVGLSRKSKALVIGCKFSIY